MEFRHLRYFLVLADELHFGRAALRLSITQPPLSLNIQQLEEAIGAQLFERNSKGVSLTAAGVAFRGEAQVLLTQAEQAQQRTRDVGIGVAGRLRIGFVGSMLLRGLPQWVEQFGAARPRIELCLNELNSQEQIEAFAHGELDLGFVHCQRVPDGMQVQSVQAEPFICCLPAGHRLVRRRCIALTDLRDEPFVLFARSLAPDYYNRIIEACAAQGFTPCVRHEMRDWLSVVSLVGQGAGLSIVPTSLARAGMTGAVFRPLVEALAPSEVFAIWTERPDPGACQAFLDLALRSSRTIAAPESSPPRRRSRSAP
jgi:DNA-binding transcriptional LysR family regulator